MTDGLRPDELVAGRRYRVTLDDCCVRGYFDGRFVEIRHVPNSPTDPTPFADAIEFDVGEVGPVGWGSWRIDAIEETP